MFDAETLREELTAIEQRLQNNPRDKGLINLAMNYARQLRQAEYDRDGYVTARNGVTGY